MANLFSSRSIVKIASGALEEEKWNVNATIEQLQEDGFIVKLASSYITRTLDEIANTGYDEKIIKSLKRERSKLKKDKTNLANGREISNINNKLKNMLFMPHIACVRVANVKHYDRANKGFYINGIKYVRFLSTSASIKKSDVFYVNEQYIKELQKRVDNGRKDKEFVPAKLSAYRSLTMSASNPVTNTPRVLVVHDVETKFTTPVIELGNAIKGRPEKKVIEDYEMTLNASDGFGFIDPEFAKVWADDLHLDYVPSGFITRNSFCKGVSIVFDYKLFALEKSNSFIVRDVWGNEHDIRDIDVVLTTSMLKLWDCYDSYEHYHANCVANGYTFSVTKQTPKTLDEERHTNYQFIQSLDLTDEEIIEFIKPTIQEIKEVMGLDYRKSLLYLRGVSLNEKSQVNDNNYSTALMINNDMIKDPFVLTSINNMIKKKINDAKIGVIKVRGNYQTITIDPICLAQSIFGLEVKGLLKENQIYSKFWIDKGVEKVATYRAPMVAINCATNIGVVTSGEMEKWYKHLDNMLIINAWDSLCARQSGMDADGDTLFTTDNKYMIKGTPQTLPIVCLQKSASKKISNEKDFIASDKLLLANKSNNVGSITNKATSIQSIQSNFEKGTKEWEELDFRIISSILHSQESIDVAKGIKTSGGIPKEWVSIKPNLVLEDDTEEVIAIKEFNRTLVADKKEYFFIYIYPQLMKEYKDHLSNENKRCRRDYRMTLNQLIELEDKTEEQQETIKYFEKYKPVNETNCLMNKICWHIEKEFSKIKELKSKDEFDPTILKTSMKYTVAKAKRVEEIYKSYIKSIQKMSQQSSKLRLSSEEKTNRYEDLSDKYKNEMLGVCNNMEELTNILIDKCYKSNTSKYIAWSICGEQIIKNLLASSNNIVSYPIRCEQGEFDYMGYTYKMHSKLLEVD